MFMMFIMFIMMFIIFMILLERLVSNYNVNSWI